ncbi:MAG: hypothetical protein WC184_11260 [Acidimicrobiia bacterium]
MSKTRERAIARQSKLLGLQQETPPWFPILMGGLGVVLGLVLVWGLMSPSTPATAPEPNPLKDLLEHGPTTPQDPTTPVSVPPLADPENPISEPGVDPTENVVLVNSRGETVEVPAVAVLAATSFLEERYPEGLTIHTMTVTVMSGDRYVLLAEITRHLENSAPVTLWPSIEVVLQNNLWVAQSL